MVLRQPTEEDIPGITAAEAVALAEREGDWEHSRVFLARIDRDWSVPNPLTWIVVFDGLCQPTSRPIGAPPSDDCGFTEMNVTVGARHGRVVRGFWYR
jgi:hypothetical protein